jgi:hypothetical protein
MGLIEAPDASSRLCEQIETLRGDVLVIALSRDGANDSRLHISHAARMNKLHLGMDFGKNASKWQRRRPGRRACAPPHDGCFALGEEPG